jgi:hypothetical protein
MTAREELHRLVDQLAESDLAAARRLLISLAIEVDEDTFSPEEVGEIEEGAEQIRRGEYVTLDALESERET